MSTLPSYTNFTEEIDFTKLKYALYVRKSTDDDSRQVRSIEDQIKECREMAVRLGLRIVTNPALQEKKSAKLPNQRPIFTQMLRDLADGRYDGIIAWNPDRLARNMLEGGHIIDMIDQGRIKDLKFVTHHFTKDANGKMLLGMAFVLSKQYSDNLSQNVSRGVRNKFLEGKSPIPKYGYIRDEDGYYQPDSKNFDLIRVAWDKRNNGDSIESIVEFLNQHDFHRVVQSNNRKLYITKQKLSNMFKDPFYYGILIQAGNPIDLRQLYNFQPATTESTYQTIQQMGKRNGKPFKSRAGIFLPLKQMVKCAYCGATMYAGASKSSTGKKYLYYRCITKDCERKAQAIRAKVIFNFIYDFLENGLNLTEKEYNSYYKNMAKLTDQKRTEIVTQVHSLEASLKLARNEHKRIGLAVIHYQNNEDIYKINIERMEQLKSEIVSLESSIEKTKAKLGNPDEDRLTLEQFLNLSKNAGAIVRNGDEIIKDTVCRFIFLNFCVDDEKVLNYQLKSPFDELLKNQSVLYGRRDRTRTCGLTLPKRAL